MANTYTQIYIQVVFAVQERQNLVRPERREEPQKYMTGIVTRQGQKLIAIHCMPDRTHILVGLKPNSTNEEGEQLFSSLHQTGEGPSAAAGPVVSAAP
ncbi:MAG: transposase [Limisphaerales bacterium]